MKVTTPTSIKPKFPKPTPDQVLVLEDRNGNRQIVLYSPPPHGAMYLFVGCGSNSYIREIEFLAWINDPNAAHDYEFVGLYPLHKMEVTFNA